MPHWLNQLNRLKDFDYLGPDVLSVQVLLPRKAEFLSSLQFSSASSWDREAIFFQFFIFPPRISIFVDTFNELFFLISTLKFLEDVHFLTIYIHMIEMATRPPVPLVTGRPLVHFFVLVGAEVEKYEWFLVFDDGGFPIIAAWPNFDDGRARSERRSRQENSERKNHRFLRCYRPTPFFA